MGHGDQIPYSIPSQGLDANGALYISLSVEGSLGSGVGQLMAELHSQYGQREACLSPKLQACFLQDLYALSYSLCVWDSY